MNRGDFLRGGVALLAAALLAGCGTLETTQMRDVWWAKPGQPYRKIAVVPMSSGANERKVIDAEMAQRFATAGVDTVPGESMIEGARVADGKATVEALRASGADAVLYIWLRRDDSRTVPGTNVQPSIGTWNWFGTDPEWYASPQLQRLMVGRFEARLYDMKTQKLMWTANTATFYPKSVEQDAPGVAKAIVGDLASLGFTPRKP
jgi:hypothetical protein